MALTRSKSIRVRLIMRIARLLRVPIAVDQNFFTGPKVRPSIAPVHGHSWMT